MALRQLVGETSSPMEDAILKKPKLTFAVIHPPAEHQDPIWAHTAIKEVYPGIREVIEETRYGYKRGKHDRV